LHQKSIRVRVATTTLELYPIFERRLARIQTTDPHDLNPGKPLRLAPARPLTAANKGDVSNSCHMILSSAAKLARRRA
jgi:hypothetical protein